MKAKSIINTVIKYFCFCVHFLKELNQVKRKQFCFCLFCFFLNHNRNRHVFEYEILEINVTAYFYQKASHFTFIVGTPNNLPIRNKSYGELTIIFQIS